MTRPSQAARLLAIIQHELRQLAAIKPSDRPWEMPIAAALASGLPLLVGAWFGRMDYGLISSLGGLVFLYLPQTPLHHRMVSLMACAFALTSCYALGIMSHLLPPVMVLVLTFIAILVVMLCRFYQVGIPGSLFFITAASIGAYSPTDILLVPLKVGLVALGCLLACLIAFFYSVYILRRRQPKAIEPLPPPTFDFVIFDAVVIGLCVGLSLALAQLLQMPNAYWVPVSCLAVIQGVSLRAIWERQVHRILGTAIGLLLAWGLLSLPLDNWGICLVMMLLACIIEAAVVRHYGFATVFITPLTILLADAATLGQGSTSALIQARFYDTLLGCLVGLIGGICLHSPRFREVVGRQMRRLGPGR
jgi:uncharacterized membrane protein YccC